MATTRNYENRNVWRETRKSWLSQAYAEMNSVIFLVDARGSIIHANRTAREVFGSTYENLVGAFYGKLITTYNADPQSYSKAIHGDPIVRCLADEDSCTHVLGVVDCPDGRICAIEGSVFPTYKDSGESDGAVFIGQTVNRTVDRSISKLVFNKPSDASSH